MAASKARSGGRKWYDKYLPFVAKSPEMQAEWLRTMLSRLRDLEGKGKSGVLSREEVKPYIRLLLENSEVGHGLPVEDDESRERLVALMAGFSEEDLQLMMECAEIYEVPKILNLLVHCSRELAIIALKKTPPPYEKSPLLVIDRVFHAVREKSTDLLSEAAAGVLAGKDAPEDFSDNYERFQEIMMDEQILSVLYPKAK